ncbi:hypothetical protein HJC23_008448 [Cyclotella cryptica]|uniref:Uncharacterized protein n=1 Tax=Cyclotella cryptica TaxID=29204 RepID=A0ABD3QVZ1_9STRA
MKFTGMSSNRRNSNTFDRLPKTPRQKEQWMSENLPRGAIEVLNAHMENKFEILLSNRIEGITKKLNTIQNDVVNLKTSAATSYEYLEINARLTEIEKRQGGMDTKTNQMQSAMWDNDKKQMKKLRELEESHNTISTDTDWLKDQVEILEKRQRWNEIESLDESSQVAQLKEENDVLKSKYDEFVKETHRRLLAILDLLKSVD